MGINIASVEQQQRQLRRFTGIARHADHVICTSACSRDDFLRHFQFAPERTHVVHLGVDEVFVPSPRARQDEILRTMAQGRPYLLMVGAACGLHPRRANKNLLRVLQAWAQSSLRADYRLLIAGSAGAADLEQLQTYLREHQLTESVRPVGYVDEALLRDLYSAASALVFPSTYEGFGLPIVEAMACATPVLTSLVGSCPEAAAGHATLVDPLSVSSIAEGLDAVVRTSGERIEAARRHASSRNWKAIASETLAVYQRALS